MRMVAEGMRVLVDISHKCLALAFSLTVGTILWVCLLADPGKAVKNLRKGG